MSEMESKSNSNAVQSILSGAIEATAGLADAQRRYGGSCHSLASVSSSNGERRSRIPLPRSAVAPRDTSLQPLSGRSTPALRRESSLAQIHYVSKKKVRTKKKKRSKYREPLKNASQVV